MNLPVKGITARTPEAVAQSVERLASAVAAGWAVEHLPSGRHATVSEPVPFVAANFHAASSMTWTVAPSEVSANRVMQVGTLLRWTLEVYGSTIGGVVSNNLRIYLPNNARGRGRQSGTVAWRDAGGTGSGIWIVTDGSNVVQLFKDLALTNWTAGGSAGVVAQFVIEVMA